MSRVPPSREADRIILRLPGGMRDGLKRRAALNHRTMNGEAVYLIERGIEAVDGKPNQDLQL